MLHSSLACATSKHAIRRSTYITLMTADDSSATSALLSLQILADGHNKPIHHAYLHPTTMARLHLSCNQPASLTAPTNSSSTSPTLPCLVHVWPHATIPLDTVQLHSAAAATFALAALTAVHLTAVVNSASVTDLPAAVQLNILRWLTPVTAHSTLPASANSTTDQSTDAAIAAAIGRQLWGRVVVGGTFTIVSILSQPYLLHVHSTAPASTISTTAALITPATAVHCTVSVTSPASLAAAASSHVMDWVDHVVATFQSECTALTQFFNLHTHSLLTHSTHSTALLVCGGSGTGKSAVLSVIGSAVLSGGSGSGGSTAGLYVRRLTCGELIASSGTSGELSSVLTEVWQQCSRMRQRTGSAAVLVVDDITPLLTTNNYPSLSSQLLTLLDSASSASAASSAAPLLIAACDDSRPIAPHWLRAGRFDEQLHMRPLNATHRQRVLDWWLTSSGLTTSSELLERVASRLHGGSVRQLVSVWRYATLLWAEERMEREREKESEKERDVSWKQWETAIQTVASPTTSSLLSSTSPVSAHSLQPTTADPFPLVGGYTALKKHLLLLVHSFLRPPPPHQPHTTHSDATFARPTGILLHGPAGCGKSLLLSSLAALATSPGLVSGTLFGVVRLHVAAVLSPYLGESERQLRAVFEQAKAAAPCLLLVDDIDTLVGSRGDAGDGGGGGDEEGGGATRLLTTLLVLLDGIDSSPTTPPVLLVATTTSPSTLDSALLRPGRLSNQLFVALPTADDRRHIVQRVAEVDSVEWSGGSGGVGWDEVVRRTRGSSGADLCGLVRRSVWLAWCEERSSERQQQQKSAAHCVEMRHLRAAMDAIGCSD